MQFKTILAVLALTAAPSLALAQGCNHAKMQQSASQCALGQVWDAATEKCVTPVSS